MRVFGVSKPTVINALKFRTNSELAQRIRSAALRRGGVEAIMTTTNNTARI